MFNVLDMTGDEVIDCEDAVSFRKKAL